MIGSISAKVKVVPCHESWLVPHWGKTRDSSGCGELTCAREVLLLHLCVGRKECVVPVLVGCSSVQRLCQRIVVFKGPQNFTTTIKLSILTTATCGFHQHSQQEPVEFINAESQ